MIRRDTFAWRTLLAAAHQRKNLDESRCRTVFEFLHAANVVQAALHAELAKFNLTDLKLGVLTVLFAVDPSSATGAELAEHTGATRSSMTTVLDQLEAQGLVLRQRDATDRRLVHVQLTTQGRSTADRAISCHLENSGGLAVLIEPSQQEPLLTSCALLAKAAERLARGEPAAKSSP